jgi:hypothetical protein
VDENLTLIREVDSEIVAYCPRCRRSIGMFQTNTRHGGNAVATEARAHDDTVHGTYRNATQYWATLAVLNEKGTT